MEIEEGYEAPTIPTPRDREIGVNALLNMYSHLEKAERVSMDATVLLEEADKIAWYLFDGTLPE